MSMLVHMGQSPRQPANAFSQAINAELRAILGRRRMTQQQLADATGISQPVVSRIIYRDQASLDTNQLDAVCKALDVPVIDVLAAAERSLAKQDRYRLAAKEEEPDINDEEYL